MLVSILLLSFTCYSRIPLAGAREVARCLQHGGRYSTLDLSGNALTAASATVLFDALAASDVRAVKLKHRSRCTILNA